MYTRLHEICPGQIHVVYASHFSLQGGLDPGFSRTVVWDSDLMEGYPSTVLDTSLKHPPKGWNGLKARGLPALIRRLQPKAILLNSLSYRYDHVAYASAVLAGIPLWVRCETQDEAFSRSTIKNSLRSAYYRLLYTRISVAFPIGELNRQHWLRHGLRLAQLHNAYYCTPDRAGALTHEQKEKRRQDRRSQLGIQQQQLVVAFFGKLIPKKNPNLLLNALQHLSRNLRNRLTLLFVGSGELKEELEYQASTLQNRFGVRSFFPGFVNQSALVDWYLAADVVVLPSRRTGETWGLVVNEALQAGCAVVVSDAVGCAADFGSWERFRTIPVDSPQHLARALTELSIYSRSFDWAAKDLKPYSIEAAAQALASAMAEQV
jgi:glycosyltransferase involved in cell wall biosynthesis